MCVCVCDNAAATSVPRFFHRGTDFFLPHPAIRPDDDDDAYHRDAVTQCPLRMTRPTLSLSLLNAETKGRWEETEDSEGQRL